MYLNILNYSKNMNNKTKNSFFLKILNRSNFLINELILKLKALKC